MWQLNETMLLHTQSGRLMDNIIYTFNFYDPWDYVTSDQDNGLTYPGSYTCDIAFRGWVPLFCDSAQQQVCESRTRWPCVVRA